MIAICVRGSGIWVTEILNSAVLNIDNALHEVAVTRPTSRLHFGQHGERRLRRRLPGV